MSYMTSKQALENVKQFVSCNHPQESIYLCETEEYKIIEKNLKAFEIIKKLSGDEIRVLFNFLSFDNMDFTDFVGYIGDEYSIFITEEEFNLLKRCL